MKIFLSIFLITLILLQTFSKGLIILDYSLNKDFITRVLCINRDKLQLACEGKCQLSKKLQKAEETEKRANHSSVNSPEMIWFYQASSAYNLTPYTIRRKLISFYSTTYHSSFLTATFHPPQYTS